jgi:tetratricopeptide (TPR) repeat protein
MTTRTRRGWTVAALLPLLLAGGCMSASKRYEQGIRLEERGQAAEAARRYVDALRRDPSLTDARDRLRESGAQAVEQYLATSDRHAAAGAHADAAEALLELDALRRDASGVGVELAVPAEYAAHRRARLDRAVEWSLEEADRLAAAGRHGDALARLDRAVARWAPSAEHRGRMDEARLETFVAWSEHEAAAGRFRASFEVAERGLALFGGERRLVEAQERALEAGTVRVAVLPVQASDGVARELGAAFVRDLDDELELGGWTMPPAFVQMADPRAVRVEARRYRAGELAHVSDAARLGRALDAHLVVMVEVDSVALTATDERSERRSARTRGGADTAYTVASGRREAWARVRYTLVDVPGRRRVSEETVTARVSRPFREGRYAGDWRQLLLGRDDQRLFDANVRDDARGELATDLTRQLAEELPRRLYDRLLRDIR